MTKYHSAAWIADGAVPARPYDERECALAELVQVLLIGEESAALAFGVLARQRRRHGDALELTSALTRIAAEESAHERLLLAFQSELPRAPTDRQFDREGKQFFRNLASRDAGEHFTRIATLDSAVCLLMASLRKSQPALFAPALQRIYRDEAQHVAVACQYAKRLCVRSRRMELAADTRRGLTALLQQRADCFEILQIDPDRLFDRLRQPPRFLCH